ncbi:hypothetical protein [Streptomyces sp. NPDC059009]|uniref:hypothetical protein n=1 Tax=Streptomyces sp. NPDC059009 TaxID=3346694 RepID=UPI0036A93634
MTDGRPETPAHGDEPNTAPIPRDLPDQQALPDEDPWDRASLRLAASNAARSLWGYVESDGLTVVLRTSETGAPRPAVAPSPA